MALPQPRLYLPNPPKALIFFSSSPFNFKSSPVISLPASLRDIKTQTLTINSAFILQNPLASSPLVPRFTPTRTTHFELEDTHFSSEDEDDEEEDEEENDNDDEEEEEETPPVPTDKNTRDVEKICKLLAGASYSSVGPILDKASIEVSSALVFEVLKRLNNSSVLSLSFFRWAEKQSGFKYTTDSYNLLVESLGKAKQFRLIWVTVFDMKVKGVLTKDTFSLIARRYARAWKADEVIDTFVKMEKYGFEMELSDFNRLMYSLVKAKQVAKAQEVFDQMRERRIVPDTKSYTILLGGWRQERNLLKLDEVYREMKVEGFVPDAVTYGIMMHGYCRAGKCNGAISLFREMEANKCKPSPNIFCILITGLGKEMRLQEAVKFFELSKASGFPPEAPIYNALVGAFCRSGWFHVADGILDEMRKCGVGPNSTTYEIIIHHLIKAGKPKTAYTFFQEMSDDEECEPTLCTYEVIMRMFCNEKRVDMAIKIWDEMKAKGVLPGLRMFSMLINSLCHEDKVDEACEYFQEMLNLGIRPREASFRILKRSLLYKGRKDTIVHLDRQIEKLRKGRTSSMRQ